MKVTNFKDHFLIAMPSLVGSCFAGTLTYICDHSIEHGAVGIVVNKPLKADLLSLLENVDSTVKAVNPDDVPVYFGGPVQVNQGFVLHRPIGNWSSTVFVTEEVGLTTSNDILLSLMSGDGTDKSISPRDYLVSVGYAGWSPGQLEEELRMNSWLSVNAESSIIFDLPHEKRLKAAMDTVGVSSLNLVSYSGNS